MEPRPATCEATSTLPAVLAGPTFPCSSCRKRKFQRSSDTCELQATSSKLEELGFEHMASHAADQFWRTAVLFWLTGLWRGLACLPDSVSKSLRETARATLLLWQQLCDSDALSTMLFPRCLRAGSPGEMGRWGPSSETPSRVDTVGPTTESKSKSPK